MLVVNEIQLNQINIVEKVIRLSFASQAQMLVINKKDYPNYVAFETSEKIEKSMNNGDTFLLAYVENIPVATVRYSIDLANPLKGYINRLAVLPEYRGNDYGKVLMDNAEKRLFESRVREIEISIVKLFDKLEKYYNELGYKYLKDQTFKSLPFEVRFMIKKLVNI